MLKNNIKKFTLKIFEIKYSKGTAIIKFLITKKLNKISIKNLNKNYKKLYKKNYNTKNKNKF